ncbi:ATPase involved in DNA repair/chromosome segregation, partial [Giardia duodenalis]
VDDPTGVSIDSLCRPSSSPQAITAGCTGNDGAALTDASTACGMCSGGFFLFRGGCYSTESTAGSEICTAASEGKCTTCNVANGLFKNPAVSPTLGSECILCWDTVGADKYTGVENCNTCTAPSGNTGAATCSACQAGYVKATDANECKKCGTGCSACSASDQSQCTACLEGKYLDGTSCVDASSCKGAKYPDPKINKCIQCNAAAEQGGIPECTACTYSNSLQKPVCSNCGNGGKLLRIDLDGTTTCVDENGCAAGNTHVVDNAKCLRCGDDANGGLAGCNTCSSKTTCTTCQNGYVKNSNGNTCDACGNNCATCTKANDMSTCSKCLPGYFLRTGSPNECVLCGDTAKGGIDGCAECDNQSGTLKCTKCKPNRKPVDTEGTQVTCEEKTCEDDSACGGTASACEAIVVDGDGSMNYYCSQCRQQ